MQLIEVILDHMYHGFVGSNLNQFWELLWTNCINQDNKKNLLRKKDHKLGEREKEIHKQIEEELGDCVGMSQFSEEKFRISRRVAPLKSVRSIDFITKVYISSSSSKSRMQL